MTNYKFETPISIANDNKDDDIIELLKPEIQDMIHEEIQLTPRVSAEVRDILGAGSTTSIQNGESGSKFSFPSSLSQITENGATNSSAFDMQRLSVDPFENSLNDEEKWKFQKMQLSRKNPFSRLKRSATKKVLNEIKAISDSKVKLPTLAAWLQKKQSSIPYQWQKRWVIVQEGYMLWSDTLRNIENPKDGKQRKKFNNSFNLTHVTEIKLVTKDKSQRQFITVVRSGGDEGKEREYLWKCSSGEERDFWMSGIKKHISHAKSVNTYLGN